MHYSSNKYSGRRNSFAGAGRFNNRHNPKTFDPSFVVNSSTVDAEKPVEKEYEATNAFADFKISDQLKANIVRRGYDKPTPIQDQVIPLVLAGRDVVGVANTGTGKTAAFLIPLVNKVFNNRSQRVLIITPTRELAVQIRDELVSLTVGLNIDSVLCIGGVNIGPQSQRLQRNPQFVIGTPGRLRDLEENRKLIFSNFNNIVLDEVDRMLDIGFVQEIKYIISRCPIARHSLFFSATLAPNVAAIMRNFSSDPITVCVKSTDHLTGISQEIVKVNGEPKIEVLHDLLIKKEFSKVLIFGRTKFGMERLARDLDERGFKVAAIHGNKNQSQRQRALSLFKDNHVQVLLATDVASRGLDINNVTHVINYDLPQSYEDYIHRIGRTGRANKSGVALTFVD